MATYFKPWRRKLGVVTLMSGLAFWFHGWVACELDAAIEALIRPYRQYRSSGTWGSMTWEHSIDIGPQVPPPGFQGVLNMLLLNYWWVVLPLIVLSVYLMVSKPRTSTSEPTHV